MKKSQQPQNILYLFISIDTLSGSSYENLFKKIWEIWKVLFKKKCLYQKWKSLLVNLDPKASLYEDKRSWDWSWFTPLLLWYFL